MTDAKLARRATKGDERAFAAIFDRYHQELYRFCLSILGNPEDARDALQNTMLKALKALPGEERPIRLKPWLYQVAHNEAIELLRKRRETVSVEPELTATGAGLAETAARRERLRQLLRDLADLPERQRAALVMRELGGLGFEQIAEAFDSSAAVARQTVYEARLSLRCLEEGREMNCEEVMHRLSNADGRVLRRRDLQAHLRACADCRAFREAIETRRGDFAALAPLSAATSAGLLQAVLGGAHGAAGGAAGTGGAAVAAGAGKAVGVGVVAKSVATVAVVAAIGVTAAYRGGVIHTGLSGDATGEQATETSSANGAATGMRAVTATPGSLTSSDAKRSTPGSGGTDGSSPVAGKSGSGEGKGATTGEGLPPASAHGQETAAAHRNDAATSHGHGHAGTGRGASHAAHHASHRGGSGHAKGKSPPSHVHPAPPAKPAHPKEKAQPAPETAPKAEQPSGSTEKKAKSSAESEDTP